jgi:hypothetical protein
MWIGKEAGVFLSQHLYEELMSEHGLRVRFVTINEGARSSRIEMDIVVKPDTTIEQIRKSWHFILKWRERLNNFQEPWMLGGDNRFYFEITTLHNDGMSYQEIADRINARIVEHLKEDDNPFHVDHAKDLMILAGVDEEDVDGWVTSALENIDRGRKPFSPKTPVSRQMIRSRIRHRGRPLLDELD